ncbi:hypothetical protein [Epilithonimonas arachidiradicis]|uniref:Membrane-bound lysozyme inhibitor of c-type lysozyme MliC n=1 Tax=Epilithonimonas arachidiradicis TaxID=1617282 RepID=A0A420DDT0_9FLAO|nr:hypothetical protein [Epilithonimonas arachidiradicis]RKE89719.1 hypothetical protein BXY58_0295 [Epilithonimonas arachidiradicis]GGG44736.1 hypothetical protein GCM10007332_02790 [Epilithonimonas arachidiradicis]
MKKYTLISGFVAALALVSCKKNDTKMTSESYSTETTVTDENGKIDSVTTTSMEKTVDGKKVQEYSVPYKAGDGSRAKATFTDNGKSKTIILEANNNKFVLDFKKKTAEGEFYERNTISAETKGDSLLISQDNQVMHLVRVK